MSGEDADVSGQWNFPQERRFGCDFGGTKTLCSWRLYGSWSIQKGGVPDGRTDGRTVAPGHTGNGTCQTSRHGPASAAEGR